VLRIPDANRPSEHIDMLLRRIPIVALLALLILTNLAFAAEQKKDTELPSPDRPGTWRRMTQDPETTTSRCVGETRTPLCTIETFLACHIQADWELCRIAGRPVNRYFPVDAGKYKRYRVIKVTRFDEHSLGKRHFAVGDLWIDVLEWDCNPHSDMAQDVLACRKFDRRRPPIGYVLHKTGDQWRIVYLYIPRY
jgi:hypothetical protein